MPTWVNRENLFTAVSLGVAAMLGWGFFSAAGVPPTKIAENWQALVAFMVFLILPFAKKLDFFQFFSFEAKIAEVRKEVGETKEKVADVREDVRHVIAQQNALSASVHSMNHQAVTVNNYDRPAQAQVEAATAEVADVEPVETDPILKGPSPEDKLLYAIFGARDENDVAEDASSLVAHFVSIDDLNEVRKINTSEKVAILRIRVERELKRLLEPHANNFEQRVKFSGRTVGIPTTELVRRATSLYPSLKSQRESFSVFFRIAGSAIHADEIPNEDLDTAIYLGERLLALLAGTQAEGLPE